MLNYSIKELATIVSGELIGNQDGHIRHIITDSRSIAQPADGLFIALHGPNHNGHQYINDLIKTGVTVFLVDQEYTIPSLQDRIGDLTVSELSFIKVINTLDALQELASHYRQSFSGSVLAITGSNGKTIIKEWLHQILSGRFKTEKNPKSFNSQVGVPLSVLRINNKAELIILEAGISQPGEMQGLENIIKPRWGLITNIGDAHQKNFKSLDDKVGEKLKLFKNCEKVYYCRDHETIHQNWIKQSKNLQILVKTWSRHQSADLTVLKTKSVNRHTRILARFNEQSIELSIPFIDKASVENLIHICLICLDMGMSQHDIQFAINKLEPVSMRLEQKEGINNCTLINDFYNSDIQSIKNAIDLLFQQAPQNSKTIIISDILQSGVSSRAMVEKIRLALDKKGFSRIIGIGPILYKYNQQTTFLSSSFQDTESFIASFSQTDYHNEAILLKGARKFKFELISKLLEKKIHRTTLSVHMPSLLHNLNHYRDKLSPSTKIMVMVKALAYGSGTHEIARFLAHQRVDYLGVAFVDEGIALRKAGVTTAIMAMNPDFNQAQSLISYNLEPEIFNLKGLRLMERALRESNIKQYPVHIKFDTGMHRLGFLPDDAVAIGNQLKGSPLKVASIFSHLAAAGNPLHESFTSNQISNFQEAGKQLSTVLGYQPLLHILNTTGIESYPHAHFDMVRLGIGLYGVSNTPSENLEDVLELNTYISQIHNIKPGESVGYDRQGVLEKGGKIGVIPIGYADGFNRRLGNGKWKVTVNKSLAPTIGSICMDMCMIDITGVEANEGDKVTLIGKTQSIKKMAEALNTIPYEIMASISPRVKRIYSFE